MFRGISTFYDLVVINVRFLRDFPVCSYGKCHRVRRNYQFLPRIWVLLGSTNLQSSMCNRPGVVELLRYNCRNVTISSIRPVLNYNILVQRVQLFWSLWDFTSRNSMRREMNKLCLETTSSLLMEFWRHKNFWHNVKLWWRHISVKNAGTV